MVKRKDKIRRVGLKFANVLDQMKIERIRLGVDKKFISDARLTDGMLEEPEFTLLVNKLNRKKRKEELRYYG